MFRPRSWSAGLHTSIMYAWLGLSAESALTRDHRQGGASRREGSTEGEQRPGAVSTIKGEEHPGAVSHHRGCDEHHRGRGAA